MARRLTDFEFPAKNEKYPWSDWLNGETWEIAKGEDYDAATPSMVGMIRGHAAKLGGTVRVFNPDDEHIVFRYSTKREKGPNPYN